MSKRNLLNRAFERARVRHLDPASAPREARAAELAAAVRDIRARIQSSETRVAPGPVRVPSGRGRLLLVALAAGVLAWIALRLAWHGSPAAPAPVHDELVASNHAAARPTQSLDATALAPVDGIRAAVRAGLDEVAAQDWPGGDTPLALRAAALDEQLALLHDGAWPVLRWIEATLEDLPRDGNDAASARQVALDYLAERGDRSSANLLERGCSDARRAASTASTASAPADTAALATALLLCRGSSDDHLRGLCSNAPLAQAAVDGTRRAGVPRACAALQRLLEGVHERQLPVALRSDCLARLGASGASGANAACALTLTSSVDHDALLTSLRENPHAADALRAHIRVSDLRSIEPRFLLRAAGALQIREAAPVAQSLAERDELRETAYAYFAAVPSSAAVEALLELQGRRPELDVAPTLAQLLRAEPACGAQAARALTARGDTAAVRALLALCERAGGTGRGRCAAALAHDSNLEPLERVRAVELAGEAGDGAALAELQELFALHGLALPRLGAACLLAAARLESTETALAWLVALPKARRERIARLLVASGSAPITTASRIERELVLSTSTPTL